MNNLKWEFKQKAEEKPKVLDLYIYGDIEGGNTFDLAKGTFEQSKTSAEHFKEELSKYSEVEAINLFVNSCGGDVVEGMGIRNQLKRHKAKVTGIVDGIGASAASFILTGCDEVKMYSNSMQMIHNMWTFAIGNSKELRKVADDMDKMMEGNRMAYLEKSNGKLTEEKLIELLEAETWLTAEECFEYGLCDEIIEENIDLSSAKEMMQKVNNTLEQQIKYNKFLQKMVNEPVEENIKDVPKPKVPEQFTKQLTNYEKIRQKFMKEGMNNE